MSCTANKNADKSILPQKLKEDTNKSDREILHLFTSHSFSPGDLAAKGKGENRADVFMLNSIFKMDK